ncbi:MAG: hypothetical protein J6I98_05435, partial [Clostridia bacterium]|nr:hypothetical protein [Clostridia bacterium]
KRAVLDEAYAEQKTQRENAAADRTPAPSARRDPSETPPALPRRPKSNKPRRVRPVKFTDTRLISGRWSPTRCAASPASSARSCCSVPLSVPSLASKAWLSTR